MTEQQGRGIHKFPEEDIETIAYQQEEDMMINEVAMKYKITSFNKLSRHLLCHWIVLLMEFRVLPLERENYYVHNPIIEDWYLIPAQKYYHVFNLTVILAFHPKGIIESYYHIVIAVPFLDQPIVFFEKNSSQSNSWRCSSLDFFELEDIIVIGGRFYMKCRAVYHLVFTVSMTLW
ncbi:hypothetical protein H5410_061225 [Solanum commersonii]|uniref:Uncharacterized protein n=1 Tax=Solanum commersonii TaxID=4109 RepID=A0A9J5W744_SOLCO|nr:hypothetical protein H5410_061225 [Solanum commersonii]